MSVSTVVKVKQNGQVTIPTRLRVEVGLADGDLVEATAEKGRIILTPKLELSTARGEYTRDQRRVIDARLTESLEQAKRGETHGPFETHEELIGFLHGEAKKARLKRNRSAKPSAR
jgi:AbrB family looped-hinge helix DNA binding protein